VLGYEPKLNPTNQQWSCFKRFTATLINPHNIKLLSPQNVGAGSSAWLERSTDNRKVGSSNPPRPTIIPLSIILAKSFIH
jgi:hypothetical protein